MKQLPLAAFFQAIIIKGLLLPGLAGILLLGGIGGSYIIAEVQKDQQDKARAVHLYVKNYLHNIEDDLRTIEILLRNKSAENEEILQDFLDTSRRFYRVLLLDNEDRITAVYPAGTDLNDYSGLLHTYEQTLESPSPINLTAPYYSYQTDKIVVAAIRTDSSGTHLLAEMNLEELQANIDNLTEYVNSGSVFITDSYGNLIAHPEMARVSRQENLRYLNIFPHVMEQGYASGFSTMEERRYMVSGVFLPDYHWCLFISEDAAALFSPLLISFLLILAFLLVIQFLFLSVIKLRIRCTLIEPLSHFASDMENLESEPLLTESSRPEDRLVELNSLRQSFTTMRQALSKREEELKKALQERELLLKEIHHRVKNNLGVIASLLSLQSQQLGEDTAARAALDDSRNRIMSMANIHEDLYKTENLSSIDMRRYIDTFLAALQEVYPQDEAVRIKTDVDKVYLSIKQAIPCGIIINELVTNALKYAFPGGKGGAIVVSLKRLSQGRYRLCVSDTGRGLPADIDYENPDTLGLQLVSLLANQLEGSLTIESEGETSLSIDFITE